jgi:hypothetical protein
MNEVILFSVGGGTTDEGYMGISDEGYLDQKVGVWD